MKRNWLVNPSARMLGCWILGACLLLLAPRARGQSADYALTTQTRALSVQVGQTRMIQPEWKIKRVAVGEPKVADVQLVDANRLMLLGKAPGVTDLALWGEDERLWHFRVEVDPDLERLQRDLTQLFPASNLKISHTQGVYILTGTMENAEVAERVQKILDIMTGGGSTGAAGGGPGGGVGGGAGRQANSSAKFVNLARLPGVQQVKLKVRVAEVNRTAIRELGVNAVKAGDDFFGALLTGPASGGAINPISIGPLRGAPATGTPAGAPSIFGFPTDSPTSPLVSLIAGFPNSDLEFFIQALAENQYIRILAEPTLIALSGEEASFQAGGQFPVPVVQGTTGSAVSVTIEWKDFGVLLNFTPTVLGDGGIRIHVAPEVSDLSDVGAVELEGFRIPTVLTRRAETTLEMKSGQYFVIAGLLNQTTRGRNSRIPWLGDIPVVGALFRSVRHEASDQELIVLVRTELVEPLSLATAPPVPGENERRPSDWELYGKGYLEGKGSSLLSPDQAEWLKTHQWDQLSGPGAWADHGAPQPQSSGSTPEVPVKSME